MSVKIKKIDKLTSFCGLNDISMDAEFKDYNVIFANNGAGKTSITRAFELLIGKNYQHIKQYQTIGSTVDPEISFILSDNSSIAVNTTQINQNSSFNIEIYNSDFLIHNAPLSSDFGLKKLDDKTIILEGSFVGEETKEIQELNKQKDDAISRKIAINGDINTPNIKSELEKTDERTSDAEAAIERIRTSITTREIPISISEISIDSTLLSEKNTFNVDESRLQGLKTKFDELYIAMKSFESLSEISFPQLNVLQEESFTKLFKFDIEKEAGEVGEKVKNHILKAGQKFIEDGMKLTDSEEFDVCPFCMQSIENGILDGYAIYFNDAIDKFNILTQTTLSKLNDDLKVLEGEKNRILNDFEQFRPFVPENFDQSKNDFQSNLDLLDKALKQIIKLVQEKQGIKNLESFFSTKQNFVETYKKCNEVLEITKNILDNKRAQQKQLNFTKVELKKLKILKAKKESFELQKKKYEVLKQKESLSFELSQLEDTIKNTEKSIQELQAKKRPDIKVIKDYLKVLNLSKYSVDSDYQITISQKIVQNENIRIVLSEGEKTTLAFAYFLARLKLFYNKESLKDLIVVIDDPISSLDENRIYTTSYLVAKINQEIAGEILQKSDDKAQVFVFTHSHVFMTNMIRILGKHASYHQLSRNSDKLIFESKDKAAGYFDTFYMLLFKEIINFAEDTNLNEDYDKALNNGNKIRILLESFIKTNFISQFIEKEYKQQSSFADETLDNIIKTISDSNSSHKFQNAYFSESDCQIIDSSDLKMKLDSVIKGLHMDSHGSIVDFYSQHKTSLQEVQKFAKISINVMMALNPNQVCFYIEASKK
ncbi:AAA family ATPase [Francisella sp. SYW-2]|uniref:AAA family ATPase n=1 Tax=Francisella sp. SYW-2 TaxID=2610886 RepID=UPI00123E375E|nr:AAA family ATPase [Francisella sp. SYW-2]